MALPALAGVGVGRGVGVGTAAVEAPADRAAEEYSAVWVRASAFPVWENPCFFWNAFTAAAVPLPYAPSILPE